MTDTTAGEGDIVQYEADLLLDNIACATQNRALLRGDPAEDRVLTEAVLENGKQAISRAITQALAAQPHGEAETLRVLLDNLVISQSLSKALREKATDDARSYLYGLRHRSLAAQPSAGAEGEAVARVTRFLAEWSRGIGYGETLYSDLIREVRAGTDREAKLTVTDLRAVISTPPSTDAVTSIVDAAKEAGWAMMEVVDGIAWEKRQQFSDIAARLAKSIESLESPPLYATPAQPSAGAQGEVWLPIATAPKDGTEFEARCGDYAPFKCEWDGERFIHHDFDDGPIAYNPDQWRPLEKEWRCASCGAAADERHNCCQAFMETATPAQPDTGVRDEDTKWLIDHLDGIKDMGHAGEGRTDWLERTAFNDRIRRILAALSKPNAQGREG